MTTEVSSACGAQIHLLPIPSPGRSTLADPIGAAGRAPGCANSPRARSPAPMPPASPSRKKAAARRGEPSTAGSPRRAIHPGDGLPAFAAPRATGRRPAGRRSAARLRMRAPISCRARRRKPRRRNGGATRRARPRRFADCRPSAHAGFGRSHLPESPVNVRPARLGRSRERAMNLRRRKFDWIASEKSGKKCV